MHLYKKKAIVGSSTPNQTIFKQYGCLHTACPGLRADKPLRLLNDFSCALDWVDCRQTRMLHNQTGSKMDSMDNS